MVGVNVALTVLLFTPSPSGIAQSNLECTMRNLFFLPFHFLAVHTLCCIDNCILMISNYLVFKVILVINRNWEAEFLRLLCLDSREER